MTGPETWFPEGHRLGLRELYSPSKVDVDIIFIHGLTGDPYDTWLSESGVYWPIQLLSRDIPNARILTFGFDATVTLFSAEVGQGTLRDHAETLVGEFASRRSGNTHNTPVIVVAHSLGGLVIKKALCVSAESAQNSDSRALDRYILGCCFLGTPHRGSHLATPGAILATIMKLFLSVNSSIVKVLERQSEGLLPQSSNHICSSLADTLLP
jgi:hypothetical protein